MIIVHAEKRVEELKLMSLSLEEVSADREHLKEDA